MAGELRADARRNRDAVLAAARFVFAEDGVDAPLDAIAQRAGVGRATIYRRFATREALIRAVFDSTIDGLQEIVDEADPDRAFVEALVAATEMLGADRGFVDAVGRRPELEQIAEHVENRFLDVVTEPLRAAQRAGIIRPDLEARDTLVLLDMLSGAARTGAGRERRALALLLDALRPTVTGRAAGRARPDRTTR
jgi:AcrR family transcriptional regulator